MQDAMVVAPKVSEMSCPEAKLVPVAVRRRPTGPLEPVNTRDGMTLNSPLARLLELSVAVTE